MTTHVLRISFCTAVLAMLFFSVPRSVAQVRIAAFSATDINMKDGFNNGNVVLPSDAVVPLTIGIFDPVTRMLSPLASPDMLVVQVLDAGGNPHPDLTVTSGAFLSLDPGMAVTTASLGLRWSGTGGTMATVVVRDSRALLSALSLTVVFDPAMPQDLHVTALVVYDVNHNAVYDAADIRLTDCTVRACPAGIPLAKNADQAYVLDIPQYTGPLPFSLYNGGCPGWRQTMPAKGMGRVINGRRDSVVFFMEPATTLLFSGLYHDLPGQTVGQVHDSMLVLKSVSYNSPISLAVRAAEWRMTSLLGPEAGGNASFSMTVYGEHTACSSSPLGKLLVLCADGEETLTPDFSLAGSNTYTMKIYNAGQLVYTESGRSGVAVVLPKAVRRWGAASGSMTVSELLPRSIRITNGDVVTGDLIVFEPFSGTPGAGIITEVVLGGSMLETLTIYSHDIGISGMQATCTGSAVFRGQQGSDVGLHVEGGTGGGVTVTPGVPSRSLMMHWGEFTPPEAGIQPVLSLEAFCAGEACPLGEIGLFRDSDALFSCRALSASYGSEERTVEVLNGDVSVATITTTAEMIAQCNRLPVDCRATTQYNRSGYVLSWGSGVALRLPDGQQVAGDKLRVSFHGDQPVRELGSMMIMPRNKWLIHIGEVGNDSLPAITLTATITITGQVFDDKNGDGVWQYVTAPEPGRAGRKVYLYGEDVGEIDSVFTDYTGAYTAIFDTLVCGWAPVYVNLCPAAGWQRTNGDYDMVLNSTVNQSLSDINFGEKYIPEDKFVTGMAKYGTDDMFESGVAELSSPSPALLGRMAECSHETTQYFDGPEADRWFVHTLSCQGVEECVVQEAELTMRVRAGEASPHNDMIALRRDGHVVWSGSIAALADDGTWYPGKTATLHLDLTTLPVGRNPQGLLSMLQNGDLDVVLYDDTDIDYLTYTTGLACEEVQEDGIATGVTENEAAMDIQLSPNPVAGAGVIRFGLTQSGPVTLVITDLMQREVARLLNADMLAAGQHRLKFSLPTLPAGSYFVQLLSGSTVRTYPFLLVR